MLNKTTSLLPNALFASLGMPRSDESIKEAKHASRAFFPSCPYLTLDHIQGIDHELKRACEDVISQCANPICEPLRTWIDRIGEHNTTRRTVTLPGNDPAPLISQEWVQQPAAEELDKKFRLACQRDLRESVVRLRLYLEDDRTVGVLVDHVQDRIVDEYAEFRDVIWNMYAGGLRAVVLSSATLRGMLAGICKEQTSDI
jgi:hypothetical protein